MEPRENSTNYDFNANAPAFTAADTQIRHLGPCDFPSPLLETDVAQARTVGFIADDRRILLSDYLDEVTRSPADAELPSLELSGPRQRIHFDPAKCTAAIVTCGGLCPGINAVIRALFYELHYRYGVPRVLGIPYGYEGLNPAAKHAPLHLTPQHVESIHKLGGTLLGSSRGPQDPVVMADYLHSLGVNLLFVIGGDGTQRGALAISGELQRRGSPISVIGIPKTIDNDFMFMDRSFGFETAFAEAVKVLSAAHAEAIGAYNGVGMVKLMGRESGFIACFASLADSEANFVLIPEVPFQLKGPGGLLEVLRARLENRRHALIVVAEGAGQHLMEADTGRGTDASGNLRLGDIGTFLKREIEAHFKQINIPLTLKYIDPSYTIRSVPANASDNAFCARLAQGAVHAALAGRTEMVVARWHGHFIHLPTPLAIHRRWTVNPHGALWHAVLESTGQPADFGKV